MKKQLEQLVEFHKAFGHPILAEGEQPTQERIALRKELIREEFKELKEAHESGNIEHIAKEACDLVYVLLGTVLESGWPTLEVSALLWSNISKMTAIITTPQDEIEYIERKILGFQKVFRPIYVDIMLNATVNFLVSSGFEFSVIKRCFDEVHRSNMSKLDANGKPIYREDGKVLKSELYSPADLSFLSQQLVAQ